MKPNFFKVNYCKRHFSLLLSFLLIISSLPFAIENVRADVQDDPFLSYTYNPFTETQVTEGQPNGKEATPFILSNVGDLDKLATIVNGTSSKDAFDCSNYYFRLADNFKNTQTNSFKNRIGTGANNKTGYFNGSFDGTDHSIYVNISMGSSDCVGLFGMIGSSGIVQNVTIIGTVKGNDFVGGVCGTNNGGMIKNCTNNASVSATNSLSFIGGICGLNTGVIDSCTNSGTVVVNSNTGGICGTNYGIIDSCTNIANISFTGSSSYLVGGVCGRNGDRTQNGAIIENCINSGAISCGSSSYSGGICGESIVNSTIVNCINSGSINGGKFIGGMCGYNISSTIDHCINISAVGNGTTMGALCGKNAEGTIQNCYYDQSTCLCNTDIGDNLGYKESIQSLTTVQFKDNTLLNELNAYVDTYNQSHLTSNISLKYWTIYPPMNDGYPMLMFGTIIDTVSTELTIDNPISGQKLSNAKATSTADVDVKVTTTWVDENTTVVTTATCEKRYTARVKITLSPVNKTDIIAYDTNINIKVNGKNIENIETNVDGTYTVKYTFAKLEHVWDNGELIEEPTTATKGIIFRCTACTAAKYEPIENDDPEEDPEEDTDVDPEKDPEEDPDVDPEKDPEEDPDVDPEKDPEEDPDVDPEKDPEEDPDVDPEKDPEENPNQNLNDHIDTESDKQIDIKSVVNHSVTKSKQPIKLISKMVKLNNKIKVRAKGKLNFNKLSGNKKLKVNKKTGKITAKKRLKAGLYKIKVKITAKATKKYKKATTTKVITIIVK